MDKAQAFQQIRQSLDWLLQTYRKNLQEVSETIEGFKKEHASIRTRIDTISTERLRFFEATEEALSSPSCVSDINLAINKVVEEKRLTLLKIEADIKSEEDRHSALMTDITKFESIQHDELFCTNTPGISIGPDVNPLAEASEQQMEASNDATQIGTLNVSQKEQTGATAGQPEVTAQTKRPNQQKEINVQSKKLKVIGGKTAPAGRK